MGRKKLATKQQHAKAIKPSNHSTTTSSPTTYYLLLTTKLTPLFSRLSQLLFAIIIFIIPSNLFLNLTKDNAFVQGILVDYLIPKLYLSDILIGLLFTIWLISDLPQLPRRLSSIAHNLIPPRVQRTHPYLVTLFSSPAFTSYTIIFWFMILLTSSIISTNPPSSAWTMIKLIEFILLILWIKDHLELHRIIKPLAVTMIFQSLIAFIQWVQQRSILGYLFLGETSLKVNGHLAKTSIGGQIRVLPYGTTAHPNILAGFLTIGILILLIQPKNSFFHNRLSLVTCSLSLVAICLTQSLTAIIALIIGLLFIKLPSIPRRAHPLLALSLITIITGLIYYCFVATPDSVTRRLQLTTISIRMFLHHPILGVGPNNFTTLMSNYGEVTGTTRFLQPVHNIYLLFITETGLITPILTITLAYLLLRSLDKRLNLSLTLTVPLLAVLTIGIFDHYPLSLQSGRLLLSLTAGLALSSLNPKNRANFKVTYR